MVRREVNIPVETESLPWSCSIFRAVFQWGCLRQATSCLLARTSWIAAESFFSLFLVPTHEVHLRRCLCRAPDGADKLLSSLKSSQDPTRVLLSALPHFWKEWCCEIFYQLGVSLGFFFKMLYMVSCMKVKWYSAMLHSAEIWYGRTKLWI